VFERFTDRARSVVVLAQEEARSLGHGWIGTEHLLLGLLREGSGVAAQALADLGLTHERVRDEVVTLIGRGAPPSAAESEPYDEALRAIGIDIDEVRRKIEESFGPAALDLSQSPRRRPKWWRRERSCMFTIGRLRFAPRAKRVLELARGEAGSLHHDHIGTEHILLGLIRLEEGVANQILARLGVTPAVVRVEVLRLLNEVA
jgi:ATP-dependent Clp protease ATP-binding subunit ClpA